MAKKFENITEESTNKEKVVIRRRKGEDSRIINGEKKKNIQADLKKEKEEAAKKAEFEKNAKEKIRLFLESREK